MRIAFGLLSWALWTVFPLLAQSGPPSPAVLSKLPAPERTQVEQALGKKDLSAAAAVLARHVTANPDPQLYAVLGGLLFLDKQFLNAGIALSKSDALAPLPEPDRFTLAMCYVVLGMPDKARRELTRLNTAAPANANYLYWLSRLDYDAQQHEKALTGFSQVLTLDPKHVRAQDNAGLALEALGRNDEALAAYRKASALQEGARPCTPWPGHNLGALLRKLGRSVEAEQPLRASIDCDGGFAKSRYQLGLVLELAGQKAEAEAELRAASSLDTAYPEPHFALARLLRNAGKAEEARQQLQAFEALRARQRASANRATGGGQVP